MTDAELELERAKLLQERELKDKELVLKDKELELRRQESWWTRWSTPAIAAIVAGFIGIMGTLFSSYQSRLLERQKQEGALILEAIKTTGNAEEKEKQAAANLVFFADAGLITSIKETDLAKLRDKAQGAGPALPAAQPIEFKNSPIASRPSSYLTADLQSKLQSAVTEYRAWLARIGYDPNRSKDHFVVRVVEDSYDNTFFDGKEFIIGGGLARDPGVVLWHYTRYVLMQVNPPAFQFRSPASHMEGFASGLQSYFLCSYLNERYPGTNLDSLVGGVEENGFGQQHCNLDESTTFKKGGGRDANLSQAWGAAFWELRKQLGREKSDRLLFAAWKLLQPVEKEMNETRFYVDTVVGASKSGGDRADSLVIRQTFARRKLS